MKNLKDFEFGKVEVDSVFGGKVQESSSQNTVTLTTCGCSKDDGDDSDWD
jgi:hypothetical protein|tara:strand:- start:1218 stop:1367 length:150 start_codon:yes stop_codon:yes gene_type:complete